MPAQRQHPRSDAWRRTIAQYIATHPDRPLKPKPLARELGIPNPHYTAFRSLLRRMLEEGSLVLGPGRTLRLPRPAGEIEGTFRATRHGYGFIERPGGKDLYVPRGSTGRALDGDTVAARLSPARRRAAGPRAAVTRIIQRAPLNWVGTLERIGTGWFVRPQGKAPLPLVQIDDPTAKNAKPGDLVVVEPLEHTVTSRSARGVIIEKLGPSSDSRNKVLAVTRRYGLSVRFAPEVGRAAQRATRRFDTDHWNDREDLRELLTITIDPADARDFDDAISVEPLPASRRRLGVHIADVAHFVRADGVLDREARRRSTSVYLPGLVVPMLPEALSNGVCSLQPGAARLVKSVFLTYDNQARVVEARFANAVIRSDCRLTYEQASSALQGGKAALEPRVVLLLKDAERLARRIHRRRLANGMIVLSLPEVEIRLGGDGQVVDAGPADTSFSHTIIEMFMVEANEAVCRLLGRAGIPHLRRVHPEPEPNAGQALAQLAPILGRKPPETLDRETILRLLEGVRGKPEAFAVARALLRALAQAVYSPSAQGHFALASKHYCHFTSPIRRYPDLLVHRRIDEYLGGGPEQARGRRVREIETGEELVELGRETSTAERRAQQAEREAKDLLLLELMRDKVGESFDGIITAVTQYGAYVQVFPYLAEGLVHVRDFGPDNWEYDKRRSAFIGPHSRRIVALGHAVRVVVASVDEDRQELSLVPSVAGAIGVVVGRAGRSKRGGRAHQTLVPRRVGRKKRGHQGP